MKLLTVDELATFLRVSKPTAYNLIHSQGFPKVKVGRSWRIDEELLTKWIQKNSLAY